MLTVAALQVDHCIQWGEDADVKIRELPGDELDDMM